MLNLMFGMCKSQHTADVSAQRERRQRRKITKSVKEIRTHLNLHPPSSLIAPEGEESTKIESSEARIARFDEETPAQQWYRDANFSGFGFDFGGTAGASSSHPPPYDSLLRLIHKMMKMMKKVKKAEKMKMMMSEASRRPSVIFLVLNDIGAEISIKDRRHSSCFFSILFYLKKSDCPVL
jgi:hypothetical protein